MPATQLGMQPPFPPCHPAPLGARSNVPPDASPVSLRLQPAQPLPHVHLAAAETLAQSDLQHVYASLPQPVRWDSLCLCPCPMKFSCVLIAFIAPNPPQPNTLSTPNACPVCFPSSSR